MKRTFQPSNLRRKRKHGFRARMRTKAGRLVLKRRRAKGRKRVTVQANNVSQEVLRDIPVSEKMKLQRCHSLMPLERPSEMEDCKFRKKERLTRKTDFQRILKNGTRYTTENFTVIIHNNNRNMRRIGISVSKKVGGAVKRNRVKRLIREFFRLHKEQFPNSKDFLFIAKPGSTQLNYRGLAEEILIFLGTFELPDNLVT